MTAINLWLVSIADEKNFRLFPKNSAVYYSIMNNIIDKLGQRIIFTHGEYGKGFLASVSDRFYNNYQLLVIYFP